MGEVPLTGTEWLRQQAKPVPPDKQKKLEPEDVCQTNQVEAWLRKHNVKYSKLLDLPLSMIDEKRSRANQARSDAIITESVERYAVAVKAGDIFPPIVVYPSSQARVTIIDGNNREAAYRKAGRTTIPAYVIDPDTPSEVIQLLTVDANAHHGVTPDLQWRLVQAQYLVDLNFSKEQAASAAMVSVHQLTRYQNQVKAEQRAKALRVPNFSELPAGTKETLGGLNLDSVFIQAANTAIKSAMSLDDTKHMVRDLKAQSSEAEMLRVIETVVEERKLEAQSKKAATKSRIPSQRQSLVSALGKIAKVDTSSVMRSTLTEIEQRELIRRCYDASAKLLEITTALETVMREARDVS